MDDLVLTGGCGHCISILDTLHRIDENINVVITDPDIKTGTKILRSVVVGNDECLEELYNSGCHKAFISIGSIKDTSIRRKLDQKLSQIGFNLINIIDPSSVVSEFTEMAEGIFIGKNAAVNAASTIGREVIINTGAIIEHECHIGDFTHVACGAILCGGVSVGNDSLIGAGSTVIEGITIGSGVVIGAGSTVLRDVNDGEIVGGLVK